MVDQSWIEALAQTVGQDRLLTGPAEVQAYSYDASFAAQQGHYPPEAVVLPKSREDVAKVVAFAAGHGIPITPRGAATGLAGGAVPVRGGILIDLSQLRQLVKVDADNLQAIVEPGVVHAHLDEQLRRQGLFFPPDPGSSRMCTVGGMVSTNARGMRAMKYGATGDYVLGLEVVLPSGKVIAPGLQRSRALQSSSGLELAKVFVGAEGILGIITLLRLKVLPLPEARGALVAFFSELETAGSAVVDVLRAGLLPSAIEILDRSAIRAVNLYRPDLALPEAEAMLLFEVDGNRPGVTEDLRRIGEVMAGRASSWQQATDPERVAALWEARHVVGAAASHLLSHGTRVYAGEDIAVPPSRVAEALRGIRQIGEEHGILIVTFGHVHAGNLHPALVVDQRDQRQWERVPAVADAIHQLAYDLEGTVTGEHGVGIARLGWMEREHSSALEAMGALKRALDPQGIMNPGKVLP